MQDPVAPSRIKLMPRAPRLFTMPRTRRPDAGPRPEAPLHSDWAWQAPAWRPGAPLAEGEAGNWTDLLPGTRLCLGDESRRVLVRREQGASGVAAPLVIEAGGETGGFLSLAVDLPPDGIDGLGRHHILRVETRIEAPGAGEIFLRLNLRHGPNTERLNRGFPPSGRQVAEFDLFTSGLDGTPVEAGWVDLIVVRPAPGRIMVGDLVLSRRFRAEV